MTDDGDNAKYGQITKNNEMRQPGMCPLLSSCPSGLNEPGVGFQGPSEILPVKCGY